MAVQVSYPATAQAITIGLDVTPLASSATLVLGRESTAIDNTSNLDVDHIVSGFITVGTTPTIDTRIEVWAYASWDGGTNYPDVLDGTDSDETMTSVGIKNSSLALAAVLDVDAVTSDRAYYIRNFSVAQLFGGILPPKWGLFVTHNTGVALNTTAANHDINYDRVQYTVT